ncbi:hypothetical protein [Thalassotalea fusca]
MSNSKSVDKVADSLAELPEELTPDRDLWPGIEKAIAVTPQDRVNTSDKRFIPVAWAASVALAAVLTWQVMTPVEHSGPLTTDLVSVMEYDFNEQKSVMLASFGQPNLSSLPADMQAQLASLKKARQSIVNALKEQPNNSDLLNLLRYTQQQELNLIEKLYSPQWQTI